MAKAGLKLDTIESLSKPETMPWSSRLELKPMLLAFKVPKLPSRDKFSSCAIWQQRITPVVALVDVFAEFLRAAAS